jgi:hypothetical protein
MHLLSRFDIRTGDHGYSGLCVSCQLCTTAICSGIGLRADDGLTKAKVEVKANLERIEGYLILVANTYRASVIQ